MQKELKLKTGTLLLEDWVIDYLEKKVQHDEARIEFLIAAIVEEYLQPMKKTQVVNGTPSAQPILP